MRQLASVLRRYVTTGPLLGNEPFPSEALRNDLVGVMRSNGRYFAAVFTSLLVLLLLAVVLLAKYSDQPAKAGAVLAASGVSIPFLLRTLLRMWETKANTETLVHLATALQGDALRAVLKVLSEPMMKKSRW